MLKSFLLWLFTFNNFDAECMHVFRLDVPAIVLLQPPGDWHIFVVNICTWLFSFWSYPGAIKGLPGANLHFCARYFRPWRGVHVLVSARACVGLTLLADKEKPHKSCLLNDDQSITPLTLAVGHWWWLSTNIRRVWLFRFQSVCSQCHSEYDPQMFSL